MYYLYFIHLRWTHTPNHTPHVINHTPHPLYTYLAHVSIIPTHHPLTHTHTHAPLVAHTFIISHPIQTCTAPTHSTTSLTFFSLPKNNKMSSISSSPPPNNPTPNDNTTPPSSLIVACTTHVPLPVPTSSPPSTDPPLVRKFPAPCWTQEETLALIGSYQDKWYSLRRRNLRTADWEAVAEEVTRRCPDQTPPKTSAQCRHKMEKLRKRYRTEKQRILSLPSNHNTRFFGSSWVFFDLMDAMEVGSGGSNTSIATVQQMNNQMMNSGSVGVNSLSSMNNMMVVPHVGTVGKADLEVKPYSMNHHPNASRASEGKKGDLGKYFDEILTGMGNNNTNKGKGHGQGQGQGQHMVGPAPHIKFKVKSQQHQNQQHQQHLQQHVGYDEEEEEDEEYGGRNVSGYKRKGYERYEEGNNKGNGYARKESGGRVKVGRDVVVGEMVSSIKMLGEGLVKMEKMKMEMMREIEKMRMEMEMKRSEMILESQHLIVNAFVQGLKKHKKDKLMQLE